MQRRIIMSNDNPDFVYWDRILPYEFRSEWDAWKSSLVSLSGLSLSRCYRPLSFSLNYSIELHGFCDASLDGIGCVLYMSSINESNGCCLSFVFASSRIVPKSLPSFPPA